MEIEAKLLAQDAFEEITVGLTAAQSVAGLPVVGSALHHQVDRYFDTAGRALLQGGSSLRERRVDGTLLFTWKSRVSGVGSEGVLHRVEIEEPARGRELREWVSALVAAGRISLPGPTAELAPVLEIETRRRLLVLEGQAGDQLELCVDETEFRGLRGRAQELEIEVELVAGSPEAVARVATWLAARYPLVPAPSSKYERAMGQVG